jgi:hypothetical protein
MILSELNIRRKGVDFRFIYLNTYKYLAEENNGILLNLTCSERQKCGINSLKIKQNCFQKNLWNGQI